MWEPIRPQTTRHWHTWVNSAPLLSAGRGGNSDESAILRMNLSFTPDGGESAGIVILILTGVVIVVGRRKRAGGLTSRPGRGHKDPKMCFKEAASRQYHVGGKRGSRKDCPPPSVPSSPTSEKKLSPLFLRSQFRLSRSCETGKRRVRTHVRA